VIGKANMRMAMPFHNFALDCNKTTSLQSAGTEIPCDKMGFCWNLFSPV